MTGKEAENGAAARLVAVILDAARPYDRLIIGGVAQYVNEHAAWSLYVEEDPLQKLPDLRHWHGQGIIANFDDRRVASAIRGLTIPRSGPRRLRRRAPRWAGRVMCSRAAMPPPAAGKTSSGN